MPRYKTIEFHRGRLKFASGHFTIFSKTEREPLHGHNYYLAGKITSAIDEPGITFDYRIIRNKLQALCERLNYQMLLPTQSPYLKLTEDAEQYHVVFNGKKMSFPIEDVVLLPIANVTLEELSDWFLQEILQEKQFFNEHMITAVTIQVFNGPEQSALADWVLEEV